jgi:preprotein translocase subunit SecF
MQIFHNLNIDWLGKRKIFYVVSISLFLIGLISVIVRGFHYGIDFKGGTEIVMQFQKPVNISQVRKYVENIGLGTVELKTFGSETGVLLRTELQNIPRNILPKILSKIDQVIKTV